jgi:hypothetical protein
MARQNGVLKAYERNQTMNNSSSTDTGAVQALLMKKRRDTNTYSKGVTPSKAPVFDVMGGIQKWLGGNKKKPAAALPKSSPARVPKNPYLEKPMTNAQRDSLSKKYLGK